MIAAPLACALVDQAILRAAGEGASTTRSEEPKPLSLAFLIPHHRVTGGLRIFLEHMRLQLQRGHSITAVFRPGRNDQHTALPAWGAAGLEGVQQIVLQPNQPLSSLAVLHQPGTVVLPGTFHQVPEALASVGPESVVLYLEQGHEYVFDHASAYQDASTRAQRDLYHACMALPVPLACVSSSLAAQVAQRFGRHSVRVPNGVDLELWQRKETAAAGDQGSDGGDGNGRGAPELWQQQGAAAAAPVTTAAASDQGIDGGDGNGGVENEVWQGQGTAAAAHTAVDQGPNGSEGNSGLGGGTAVGKGEAGGGGDGRVGAAGASARRVLLVGNPRLALKGFDLALAVLQRVSSSVPLAVTWVCQVPPWPETVPSFTHPGRLDFSVHIDQPQDQLPALYAGHDLYLCTSECEGFGMPMLEAMAAGVPVVTTLTPDFAKDKQNCLCTSVGNTDKLVECVLSVLQDKTLSSSLIAAGRETAQEYSLRRMGDAMEVVLRACVRVREVVTLARAAAAQEVLEACKLAVSACSQP